MNQPGSWGTFSTPVLKVPPDETFSLTEHAEVGEILPHFRSPGQGLFKKGQSRESARLAHVEMLRQTAAKLDSVPFQRGLLKKKSFREP